MPDIHLRFGKEALICTADLTEGYRRHGAQTEKDEILTNLLEPDTVEQMLRLEMLGGTHVLIAPSRACTPARLRASGIAVDTRDYLTGLVHLCQGLTPQHLLLEVGPCGLPLDPSSRASLLENKQEYTQVARVCSDLAIDGIFLSGFTSLDDLRCALMGVRAVYDGVIIASVVVDDKGSLLGRPCESLEDACLLMAEYEAHVAACVCACPPSAAEKLITRARSCIDLPLMLELHIPSPDPSLLRHQRAEAHLSPDALMDALPRLYKAGAQFFRVGGDCRSAHTGALCAGALVIP